MRRRELAEVLLTAAILLVGVAAVVILYRHQIGL